MAEDYSGWLWFLIGVGLVAVLGLAMAYAIWKWRHARHDPGSERARDQATKHRDG
jgi:hypothetical protein